MYAVSRNTHETEADQVHWLRGDLTDVAAVRRILTETKPHVIFHLSGLVTGVCGLELILPTLHSLLVSTVNILTIAVETGSAGLFWRDHSKNLYLTTTSQFTALLMPQPSGPVLLMAGCSSSSMGLPVVNFTHLYDLWARTRSGETDSLCHSFSAPTTRRLNSRART